MAAGAMAMVLGACGSAARPDGEPRGNVLLGDENNYTTTAALSIPEVETAPATDVDVCWTQVVTDLQCHPLAATSDLDNLALLRISHLTKDQVEAQLAVGDLTQAQVAGYVEYNLDHTRTCAKLSQLSFFGTPIDVPSEYVESASYTYLVLLAKGTTPGVGARTMVFLTPTAASTNTTVDVPTGCGLLAFAADLSSLEKVPIATSGPWVVDWRDVTRDGVGNAVPFQRIDRLTIGFFAGMTVSEVEARIVDIENIATTLWDVPLSGDRTADLATAQERASGATFSGFEQADPGTWILAITCSRCQSPAPVVLTVLEPR